jgi:hypothetical protein
MCRVRIIAAAGALALAGCSGSSSSAPDWLKIKPPPPALQTLQFESEPPGADVKTVQGQTCRTPCSLAVPLQAQSVTFAMNGYLPQTVSVQVDHPSERSEVTYETDPPKFSPNPVEAALQPAPPPPKPARKPHKPSHARPTASTARPQAGQPASSQPFPPPPPAQAQPTSASPFPPPPTFPAPQAR